MVPAAARDVSVAPAQDRARGTIGGGLGYGFGCDHARALLLVRSIVRLVGVFSTT
jgi:hypothetical protein